MWASNQAFCDAIDFQNEQGQELVVIADRILLHVLGDASIFLPTAIHNLHMSGTVLRRIIYFMYSVCV